METGNEIADITPLKIRMVELKVFNAMRDVCGLKDSRDKCKKNWLLCDIDNCFKIRQMREGK